MEVMDRMSLKSRRRRKAGKTKCKEEVIGKTFKGNKFSLIMTSREDTHTHTL